MASNDNLVFDIIRTTAREIGQHRGISYRVWRNPRPEFVGIACGQQKVIISPLEIKANASRGQLVDLISAKFYDLDAKLERANGA